MPRRVVKSGWTNYFIIVSSGFASMFLGASLVHNFFKPDLRIRDGTSDGDGAQKRSGS